METRDFEYIEGIWERTKQIIKDSGLDRHIYESFFAPAKVYARQDNTLIVIVNSTFVKQMFDQKYATEIKEALHSASQTNFDFKVITTADLDTKKGTIIDETPQYFKDSRLNTNLTFDTFVVGPFNTEAYQASLIVSDNPGKMYNPLFLYSDSGLGKTHLLHAIGNFVRQKFPKMRVLYISTDQFVDEFVDFIKNRKGDGNLKDFFKNVDVFLVDDIQFLDKKTETQAMFFNIFNMLVRNDPNYDKQIIITSDKPPVDLKGLEQRLVTRFQSGLTVNITRPDPESAKNILKQKIVASNLPLARFDDEVLSFYAEKFSSNIRELEGALNRLIFYTINRKSVDRITMEIVLDSLGSLGNYLDAKTKLDASRIVNTVADYYSISPSQLTGKNRISQVATARHVAMYLMRILLDIPFAKIGTTFANAHHTTVMNGVEKVEKMLKTSPEAKDVINTLKRRLKA